MASFVQYVGVNHGSADIFVAHEFLDRSDVVTAFEQVSGKGMAKCVVARIFCIAARLYSRCSPVTLWKTCTLLQRILAKLLQHADEVKEIQQEIV
jgi:hypothetical protein